MKRGEVISAIQGASEDESRFLELVTKHKSKGDPFNLVEFFQTIPKKQCVLVWGWLTGLCKDCVQKIQSTEDKEMLDETTMGVLSGIVVMIQSVMATDDPTTPPALRDTLQMLHDILLGPLESFPELQNTISQLCEGWWSADLEDKDGLVPHTLLYIVARSITEGALAADIKRVWSMRQAFLLLDFEDISAEPFKAMLLSATLQPLYINTEEGRKFLSFLFGMHPSFVEQLHQTIKYQIPYMSKLLLEMYGGVYFRAWRLSSGPYLQQIEDQCLQDLMFSAVHAPRMGQHSLFNALRKFLEQIHSQRMQKGVSEMLHRLYSPFLWRSLKVANAEVRANACTLLLDAFPLQDPSCNREEIDKVMQKQFDAMTDLLADSSVMVRVSAVVGVCRVLSYYWEMVPAAVIKTLLGKMVKDLAWDVSAVNVRVAVLQGLCIILENRLSHPLMVDLLPLLGNLLHDTSEKVRVAFLELLLLVKGMRTIKFWQICPLEHLLARVEVDSVSVVKRIVSLLMDSFQPGNISPNKQIERCIGLLRMNPGASRRFYQLAVVHLSPAEVTKFIGAILTAVMHCVECEGVEGVGAVTDDVEGSGEDSEMEEEQSNEGDGQSGVESGGWKEGHEDPAQSDSQLEEPLSLSDASVMCGLLETTVVLWEGVRDRLDLRGNKGIRKRLQDRVTKCLPQLFNTFKDGHCRSTLYLLASNLPKSSVNSIAKGTLTTLSAMSYPQDYSSLLLALTAWGQGSHVIKLTNEWLESELQGDKTSSSSEKMTRKTKGRARGRNGQGSNGVPPAKQPLLAVEFINWMLSHPACLEELKGQKEFWKLSDLFKNSMMLLELHHLSDQSNDSPPSFPLLHKCLGLYVRLCMHQQAEGIQGEGEFVERIEEVLSWGDRVLVPALQETARPSSKPSRQSTRKRKASQSHPPPPTPPKTQSHAHKVTETLLGLLSEVLMLGLVSGGGGDTLEMGVANFGARIAETNSANLLLPALSKLLYQLSEASVKSELDGIPSGTGSLMATSILLKSMLSQLRRIADSKPEILTKCLGHVRGGVGSVVVESVRLGTLSSVMADRLPTVEGVLEVVVKAQIENIKQNPGAVVPQSVDDLPPLVAGLVKQCCSSKQATSVFLSHLDIHLSETDQQPPNLLLTHQAALCLISALAKGVGKGKGVESMMRCVRQSLKIVSNSSEDDKQKWSAPLAALSTLTQTLQDTLLYKWYVPLASLSTLTQTLQDTLLYK